MHELGVAHSILTNILEVRAQKKLTKIISINLRVGQLSGFQKEALETCFEIIKKDTELESAILNITEVPITLMCKSCQKKSAIEQLSYQCPLCQSNDVELVAGREFTIDSLDVDDSQPMNNKGL